MFWILSLLSAGFTLWMAVETVRRGHAWPWLFIVLFFGPLGGGVYFLAIYWNEVLPGLARGRGPRVDLRHLASQAERLDKPELWIEYSAALREKGRPIEAVAAAENALRLDDRSLSARYQLGRSLLRADRAAEALAELRQVVDEEPTFDAHQARYELAQAQLRSGDAEAAVATTRQLTEASSRPQFLYAHAMLQLETGDPDGARRTLRTLIDDAAYVPRYAQRPMRRWVRRAKRALRRIR